jgi:N-acetylglucosamine repressor
MKLISDHETMKRNNQLVILRTIRALGPVSRVRLQRETNLSWGTITSSTKELLEKRIVEEIGAVNTGVGRRPVELDMNTAVHFVVGVRLGGSYIRSIVLDIKGNTEAEYKQSVDASGSKEKILSQLFESVDSILDKARIGLDKVVGIGVAAPGAIDARAGICLYAPHHPNWKNVNLRQAFVQRFGKPCYVDHVNNCTALGQMLFGQGRGINNLLCVLLGTGISAGIIINGEVYRGINCAAGEFGHVCIDPNGPDCACGSKGCLEAYASGPALARNGRTIAEKNPSSRINTLVQGNLEKISAETVFQAAVEGDLEALKLFEDMGFYLGLGISNLIDLFNPERVILCGRVSEAHHFFLPCLQKTVAKRAWQLSKKEIKVSEIDNASVLGAAGNVLQEIYHGSLLFDTIQAGMAERGRLVM